MYCAKVTPKCLAYLSGGTNMAQEALCVYSYILKDICRDPLLINVCLVEWLCVPQHSL